MTGAPVIGLLDAGEALLIRAIKLALVLCAIGLVIVVSYQVTSRFSLLVPQWLGTEEIARGLFVWLVALGASLGVRHGSHFALDLFANRDARVQARLGILRVAVVALVAATFAFYGWEFLQSGLRRRSLVTGLSWAWWYSSFFVGGCLMLLFALRDLAARLAGAPRGSGESPNGSV